VADCTPRDERFHDGHAHGTGAEHDVVDGVHHATCARVLVKRARSRPLRSVKTTAP
jgi:hypothetical protein